VRKKEREKGFDVVEVESFPSRSPREIETALPSDLLLRACASLAVCASGTTFLPRASLLLAFCSSLEEKAGARERHKRRARKREKEKKRSSSIVVVIEKTAATG